MKHLSNIQRIREANKTAASLARRHRRATSGPPTNNRGRSASYLAQLEADEQERLDDEFFGT